MPSRGSFRDDVLRDGHPSLETLEVDATSRRDGVRSISGGSQQPRQVTSPGWKKVL